MTKEKSSASFIEGIDFYYNDRGLMVLTEAYHRKRGHCCHSDCLHCPFGEPQEEESDIPFELRLGEQSSHPEEEWEQYLDYDGDERD